MKKAEVEIGGQYIAKVSNKLATVKIVSPSIYGGWNAVNVKTQREVRIKKFASIVEATLAFNFLSQMGEDSLTKAQGVKLEEVAA